MEKLEFRLLEKEEIECRVQQVMKDNSGCILLLYKTARTDYNLLDEVVGAMNWKCDYKEIKGNLYCEISIYNKDLQQWISKSNCGVESNTEAEKGEASDSLKRAGFVWGIGRELYTAPFTYIKLTDSDFTNSKLKTQFKVKEIGYTNRTITKLIIEDNKGNVRFTYGNVKTSENKPPKVEAKEIKAEDKKQEYDFKKDIEKALKNDKQVVSNDDLPFTDLSDEVDKIAQATNNLFKANEEREIDVLMGLRDVIASKLYELGNKDLTQAYGYYAKNYKKATFEDLDESELQEIVKRLDAKLIARKEAQ